MIARFLKVVGALAISVALGIGVIPTNAAQAAPKAAAKPTAVQISGKFPGGKLTIQQAQRPELFQQLLSEVGWLAAAAPTASSPKADKLGAKFTVTVLIKDKATQVYDLYPNAAGGPRAYRPAKQPTGKKTAAGWFYGRMTMSESLRLSGVPLKEKLDAVSGGIGGGVGEEVAAQELDPIENVNNVIKQFQQLFLLNGAVLLIILIGLGGIAFLIRRRV